MSILSVWLLFLSLPFTSSQEKPSSEITLCNFAIPEAVKQLNANFYVTYSFELDDEGKPIKISKVNDQYVGEEKINSCLKEWQFRGLRKGTRLTVIFQRRHGQGWDRLTVSGPNLRQVIKLHGECLR